jgi:hypothetical protein
VSRDSDINMIIKCTEGSESWRTERTDRPQDPERRHESVNLCAVAREAQMPVGGEKAGRGHECHGPSVASPQRPSDPPSAARAR